MNRQKEEASVNEVSTIGLDLAKHVFQAHGADAGGVVVFRKQLRRDNVLAFFAQQPACLVAMEACASAHHWAREIGKLGHAVRLIPPSYVKPFVKRQKNDMADAEAICEAAQRPTMRFAAVKSEDQQASAVVFRARDLLVRQRTQIINALRGHLAEYGLVVAKGASNVAALVEHAQASGSSVPTAAQPALDILVKMLAVLEEQIKQLDIEIARRAREEEVARRLMTVPGIGPITATALMALAPEPENFKRGRDFAAWLGLTPLQRSTGGRQKLGQISKMGERTLRRLLIIGASAVVKLARRRGQSQGAWLERMLARKPPMLVAVALANKMARTVWALMVNGGVYKAPVAAA
ncbi:transposase [Bradyrhizobium diazoefficiens]